MLLRVIHLYSSRLRGMNHVSTMQGIFEGGTSLGDVYEGLANGGLHQAVAEFLADQTSDPSAWAFPAIQHAEGFEAYQVRLPPYCSCFCLLDLALCTGLGASGSAGSPHCALQSHTVRH